MANKLVLERRRFLQLGLFGLATTFSSPTLAAALPRLSGIRQLSMHNLHTDEKLNVIYWKNGVYSRPAIQKLNNLLRDHRNGSLCNMNVRLFDLLHDLQAKLGNSGTIEIISGYRSPASNKMMASYSKGVAKNSYHCKGMAMDIRMPGTSLVHVHKAALEMGRGGVGYYPDQQFVHVDVGPVRKW